MSTLYYQTVNELLLKTLIQLMAAEVFDSFRLVGGTALSLQMGHRTSIDIDLFSDSPYGSIDFEEIAHFLETYFPFVDKPAGRDTNIGCTYFIGADSANNVKLDLFCTDGFIQAPLIADDIRMATLEEIIAMKLDVIQRGGRKKDFWDLHELLERYSIDDMLLLHKMRYPYGHDEQIILHNFTDFSQADEDFAPVCLRGKYWELIKEDLQDALRNRA